MAGEQKGAKIKSQNPKDVREALFEIRTTPDITSETILSSVGKPAGEFCLDYLLSSKKKRDGRGATRSGL